METSTLNLSIQKLGKGLIISLRGALNVTNSEAYRIAIHKAYKRSKPFVILDFLEADYISSIGLRAILELGKKVKAHKGRLILLTNKPFVKQIFNTSGFSLLFPVCETQEEVEAFLKKE